MTDRVNDLCSDFFQRESAESPSKLTASYDSSPVIVPDEVHTGGLDFPVTVKNLITYSLMLLGDP